MDSQERARILASLTDDEVEQLRDHESGAPTLDTPSDNELQAFAKSLFGGGDD